MKQSVLATQIAQIHTYMAQYMHENHTEGGKFTIRSAYTCTHAQRKRAIKGEKGNRTVHKTTHQNDTRDAQIQAPRMEKHGVNTMKRNQFEICVDCMFDYGN